MTTIDNPVLQARMGKSYRAMAREINDQVGEDDTIGFKVLELWEKGKVKRPRKHLLMVLRDRAQEPYSSMARQMIEQYYPDQSLPITSE